MWNCGNLSLRCQGRSPSGDHHEASVPMRSTGTDQPVRARKAGHAAGAKGLGQAVVVNVQLATGGDLGGNEAVRHSGADAVRLLGGSGVSREAPAPFCERPEVKLLRPTRHFPIPGGNFFRNTGGTGAWSFTPSETFDTIDLYLLNATGNGQVTVDIGGAVLATIDTGVTSGGATAVVKTTAGTGAAAALGTVNVRRNGTGGLARLFGVVTRNSAIGKVHVVNLGAVGWASVDWAPANPGVWAPNRALQSL